MAIASGTRRWNGQLQRPCVMTLWTDAETDAASLGMAAQGAFGTRGVKRVAAASARNVSHQGCAHLAPGTGSADRPRSVCCHTPFALLSGRSSAR
jgi:hypothetical protein